MTDSSSFPARETFHLLRHEARTAGLRGEYQRAIELSNEALTWAKEHGDQDDVDLVLCSRAAVFVQIGRGEEVFRELQKVLMRSANSTSQHLAAYTISIFYDSRQGVEKCRFYLELALDHARRTGSELFLANSYNRLANILIRESRFEEALTHYEQARLLVTEEQELERLALLTNTAYCHLATGNVEEGFRQLFAVRRGYIRRRITSGQPLCRLRLSFCFGYLEIDRAHPATLHGLTGLRLAEECAETELVKKALYLLGEAVKRTGDEMQAFQYFARLQEEFYPDNPFLPDLLLDNDTQQMVNLWA